MSYRMRAIIIEDGRLLLIRRRKHGREYWVFPGGGVEPSDKSDVDALQRECREEIGVEIVVAGAPVVTVTSEKFYECHITGGQIGTGSGPEYQSGTGYAGTYLLEWVSLYSLGDTNLLPQEAKRYIIERNKS